MIYMLNTKYKGKLFYSLFYLYYSAINTNPARPSIYLIRMHIGHETIASVSLPLSSRYDTTNSKATARRRGCGLLAAE